MNRNFEDAWYYVKRAGETAARGVREELEPVERRLTRLTGGEEAEPAGWFEELQADVERARARVEREVKETMREARGKFRKYRPA